MIISLILIAMPVSAEEQIFIDNGETDFTKVGGDPNGDGDDDSDGFPSGTINVDRPIIQISDPSVPFINYEKRKNKVMWGKTELKIGQKGKITIVSATSLVKLESDGSLTVVRELKKGEEFRVYSYKNINNGLYGLGGGSYVQKNNTKVKYETPSKAMLAKLNSK